MRYTKLIVAAALAAAVPGAVLAQKQSPPPLGTPKAFKLPPRHEFSLPNGMKVTLVPFGTIPKASVYLYVRTGSIAEGPNEVWLSGVTGDMMREGTTSHSAEQLAELAAGMGGEVTVDAMADQVRVGGAALSEHAAEMVKLVAEMARHPSFPDSNLERVKADRSRQLAIALSQPQPVAQAAFDSVMYPNHPYGRDFPTEAMLQGYTIQQVRDFYGKQFGAQRAHLYIVGVYDAKAVEKAARDAFGDWTRGPAPVTNPPTPHSGRTLVEIDRPGAPQSTIVMGLPVIDPTKPSFTQLEVTDAILGGTFGSRITTNIRERKGYTYSPFSRISTNYHTAYWAEQADVTTQYTGASLKEIFGEIDRLRNEAPPADELNGIKNNMIGLFTLRNASRGGIIGQLAEADLQGLGDRYLEERVQKILAVTPQQVQEATKSYLKPDQMAIVVVGDKKVIEEQVAPYNSATP